MLVTRDLRLVMGNGKFLWSCAILQNIFWSLWKSTYICLPKDTSSAEILKLSGWKVYIFDLKKLASLLDAYYVTWLWLKNWHKLLFLISAQLCYKLVLWNHNKCCPLIFARTIHETRVNWTILIVIKFFAEILACYCKFTSSSIPFDIWIEKIVKKRKFNHKNSQLVRQWPIKSCEN